MKWKRGAKRERKIVSEKQQRKRHSAFSYSLCLAFILAFDVYEVHDNNWRTLCITALLCLCYVHLHKSPIHSFTLSFLFFNFLWKCEDFSISNGIIECSRYLLIHEIENNFWSLRIKEEKKKYSNSQSLKLTKLFTQSALISEIFRGESFSVDVRLFFHLVRRRCLCYIWLLFYIDTAMFQLIFKPMFAFSFWTEQKKASGKSALFSWFKKVWK